MAQCLSPCDLRPCDLGWKSADRSGIGRRADKNSLLIQHGMFDRSGIRESAEHSWSSLNNDSSLTGILEVKLFDVCSSPAAFPVFSHPPSPSFIIPSFPVLFLSPPCHSPLPRLLCLLPFSLFYYQPFCPLISGTDCDLLPPVCLLTGFCTQLPSNSSFLSIQNIFTAFFPVWSFGKFPSRKWLNSLLFNIYI